MTMPPPSLAAEKQSGIIYPEPRLLIASSKVCNKSGVQTDTSEIADDMNSLGVEGVFIGLQHRLLQESTNNSSTNNDTATDLANLTDTEIVQQTCTIYITIFAVLIILFLILRLRHPEIYNLKKTYPALRVPIAEDSFGTINWMWKVFSINYEDISEQCGMDAATTIRLLEMGVKLSLVGVFNSVFLIPVYAFLGPNVVGEADPVKGVSLSNLEQGHNGMIATTVAAYIFFLSAMYFIEKEFEWFTSHRHAFLSKKRIENYSVFLSGLPPDMQTNESIREYFTKCLAHDAVADVHVALNIPNLEKKVAKRDALLPKLEHAKNVLSIKGVTPMHRSKMCVGSKIESIPAYEEEIEELNEEIECDIDRIQASQGYRRGKSTSRVVGGGLADGGGERPALQTTESREFLEPLVQNEETPKLQEGKESLLSKYKSTMELGVSTIKLLIEGEDGAPRNAAFVSFKDITSSNLARQAVHNHEPWDMVPAEPPRPDLVNWNNVGWLNARKQVGELISTLLTVLLCLFWTIPVSFVASLSNVDALTEVFPWLQHPVEKYDWFASLLAVLAPLLLVAFTSLLPYFILFIIKFEGLIEIETQQHPSLFAKLAAFTILQTFFISTISSTLWSSLQAILKSPGSAIPLLARALPAQSAYFIQIIIVQNLLGLGIELLRLSPVGQNFARKIVQKALSHDLTEKERNETFLGLRSLDDPQEYYYGSQLGSKIVLLQMVLYVYGSAMAPITAYFSLLIFGALAIGFRHQFIYVYPQANDSGGKLWINFTKLSITCMIVAEIVLCSVLFLREGFIAGSLLVPLIICTILVNIYYKRRHYSTTGYLPLGDCALVDSENESEGKDWLKNAYLQPALKEGAKYSNDEEKEQLSVEEGVQEGALRQPYENAKCESEIEVNSVEKRNKSNEGEEISN